ncbi:DUF86 domain-containing protein [Parabacteroides bouchesdurhonensis]|uniref:HepT-like ribonuclease domain-containing protein n=1 Tax=Parabacteroides bouchesdurhonensis TaxID=1936995 RepID=UPI000C83F751|nr:HepT-like ribonuclease domain-containing protein [Parabacteroides bouchesdurhonensis]
MREKPKDESRLLHMIEAIDNIMEFTQDVDSESYKKNKVLRFAVIKNLEIIGEAAYLLTKEFREAHSEVEWHVIIGMRHVLVHGYYRIRDEIVWATITQELQPLKKQVMQILESNG